MPFVSTWADSINQDATASCAIVVFMNSTRAGAESSLLYTVILAYTNISDQEEVLVTNNYFVVDGKMVDFPARYLEVNFNP